MATTKIKPITKPGSDDLDLYSERDIIAVEHDRAASGEVSQGINAVAEFGERRDAALYAEHTIRAGNYFMHNTAKIPVAVILLNYHESRFGEPWPVNQGLYTLDENSTVNEKRLGGSGTSLISSVDYPSLGALTINFAESLRVNLSSARFGFKCLCKVGAFKRDGAWETVINTCRPTAISQSSVSIVKGSHTYRWDGDGIGKSAPFDYNTAFAIFATKV